MGKLVHQGSLAVSTKKPHSDNSTPAFKTLVFFIKVGQPVKGTLAKMMETLPISFHVY